MNVRLQIIVMKVSKATYKKVIINELRVPFSRYNTLRLHYHIRYLLLRKAIDQKEMNFMVYLLIFFFI